jgi:gluconolactonase
MVGPSGSDHAQWPGLLAGREKLYIIARIPPKRLLFAYDVTPDGQLRNQTTLIDAGTTGALDGFRCHEDGNI